MSGTMIERFTHEHFVLNSISAARQRRVTAALDGLSTWLQKPPELATDADLRAWLVYLLEDDRMPSTVACYLKAVKPFYKWAWRNRLIDADAWMRIQDVSPPRGYGTAAPRPYRRKDLTQMWTALDERWPYTTEMILQRWLRGTSPFRSVKKHAMRLQLDAIIELALVSGLRKSEIYHLAIDDVHWDNKYIVVHGKRVDQNDKIRDVPYEDSTRDAIRAWFRLRGQMGPEPGIGLWLSITGPNPLSPLNERRMGSLLHAVGPYELHRLRHTCATERLRTGEMDVTQLQKFLGHATIAQTLRYAELVREDVYKATRRSSKSFQAAIRPAA